MKVCCHSLVIRLCTYLALLLAVPSCSEHSSLPDELAHLAADLPDEVSYNFHFKTILSDRCFNCHGPDADNREGDLRLDVAEWAYGEGEHTPEEIAIVAGDATESEVYHRILSDDPDLVMPPPESKLKLSDREKAMLIKWIDQGAEYADHWSFAPVSDQTVPEAVHPIDHFIDEQLSEKGLSNQQPAAPEQLIRRLSFDLTGLPPELEDVDKVVADLSADTYRSLIEKYLNSSAYGERMAADWMDVARYADSDGYLDDKHRDFTPWRDWVIKAFNENMPYDQFATWQLAGDLIEDRTQESILATAFNRLHRKNSEAGIVFEEYRVEYVADRSHTFGKAFLGLTTECARCHDHKYDPISQKEYYELFAFFNSTDEMGTAIYGPDQTPGPSMMLSTKEQRDLLEFLDDKILATEEGAKAALEKATGKAVDTKVREQVAADHRQKLKANYSFDQTFRDKEGKVTMPNLVSPSHKATLTEAQIGKGYRGQGLQITDYGAVQLDEKEGYYDRDDPFTVSIWVNPAEVYPEAGIFSHCEDLRLGYKGYSMHLHENRPRFIIAHSWPLNSIEVIAEGSLPADEWTHLAVSYDGSSRAEGVQIYLNGKLQENEVVVDHLYKGILYEYSIHTYGFHGFRLGYRDKIKNLKGGAVDEVRIFTGVLSQAEIAYDYDAQKFLNESAGAEEILEDHFVKGNSKEYRFLQDSLLRLRKDRTEAINAIPEIMVMGDSPQPRASYILERGSYAQRGEEVFPNTPAKLTPAFSGFEQNRLGLAKWLFHDKNPLTARVFVNRIWQQHFGRGLVKTAEDFGAQGELPTHPELLDYLARYFQDHDWDIHALHTLIVTSAAYQRSSVVSEELLAEDPENLFYARGPSQRLTAEMIRDNALEISNLLVDRRGGESVYPYQPAGLWDEISNKVWRYPYLQEPGEGLYRRSLYTIWKRTSPPPSMLIFDAPDRSFCSVQRSETNTPLQALVLLNDPQYLEAARVIASNAMDTYQAPADRLNHVARLAWGRSPDRTELDELELFFNQEKEKAQMDKVAVREYLENGEADVTGKHNVNDLIALAKTTHSLLNTYEAQMKK